MKKTRFHQQFAELEHREVKRKNLDRIGAMVLQCYGEAGNTSLPKKWIPMLERIDQAYIENPEHLVVVLWRLMADFSNDEGTRRNRVEESKASFKSSAVTGRGTRRCYQHRCVVLLICISESALHGFKSFRRTLGKKEHLK